MDEAQLSHDGRSQDERVEIGQTHAVVEAVDGIGQRQPCPDQGVEVPLAVGIEVDLHGERGIGSAPGPDTQAEFVCRFQGVHDVQVMGPGLREVLPGVGAGIAADEALLPVGGGPFA